MVTFLELINKHVHFLKDFISIWKNTNKTVVFNQIYSQHLNTEITDEILQ